MRLAIRQFVAAQFPLRTGLDAVLFDILGLNRFPPLFELRRIPRAGKRTGIAVVAVEGIVVRQIERIAAVSGRDDEVSHFDLIPASPQEGKDDKAQKERERIADHKFPHPGVVQKAEEDQKTEDGEDRTAEDRKAGQQADPRKRKPVFLPGHHRKGQRPDDQNRQERGERLGHRRARLGKQNRIDRHQKRRGERPLAREGQYQRQTIDDQNRRHAQNPVQEPRRALPGKEIEGRRIGIIRRRGGERVDRAQECRIEGRPIRRRRLLLAENTVRSQVFGQSNITVRIVVRRPGHEIHRSEAYKKRCQKQDNIRSLQS